MVWEHPSSAASGAGWDAAMFGTSAKDTRPPILRAAGSFLLRRNSASRSGSDDKVGAASSVSSTAQSSKANMSILSRGGGVGVRYKTVGNVGASVVRCEPIQGHARSTTARGGGEDDFASAASSRAVPDGATPVCAITWGGSAGDEQVFCCEVPWDAAEWLGAISWHLCR